MRRLPCRLGWHDYYYETVAYPTPGPTLRRCTICPAVWRRVRHDMDIYWERIKPRSTDV